jgi:twinkle protein
MVFHGSSQMADVLDVMRHACYTDDVSHIIVDNLQFMLSGQASGVERFQLQEETVAHLRKFATEHSCHVTLVVHPRKEDAGAPLSVSSIFGSAKVTQEADNVVILQNSFDGKPKYLEVLKNRFSGDLGCVPIAFVKDELRFQDLSPAAKSDAPAVETQPENADSKMAAAVSVVDSELPKSTRFQLIAAERPRNLAERA